MTTPTTATATRSPYSDLPAEAFAAHARLRKVYALARATILLHGVLSGEDALAVYHSPAARATLEREAGVRPASDTTWGAVVLLVRDLLDGRVELGTTTDDTTAPPGYVWP